MITHTYAGTELPLFAEAYNWKRYWHSQIAPYVTGTVLEVGAGTGNNTLTFSRSGCDRWVCLEPDAALCRELRRRVEQENLEMVAGTLECLADAPHFDTILYLDVLEDIEDDSGELAQSARILKSGGHLVVLSPAHPRLFSPFDAAVGHFRRYTRSTLRAAAPVGLRLVRCRYLDCAGLAASSANAIMLKQSLPDRRQIQVWDRLLVPISRYVDPVFRYACGKSVLGVWRKTAE